MSTKWSAVADKPDPAGLYSEADVTAMVDLLAVNAERRVALGHSVGDAAATYLRLRHRETAPRPAAVRDQLETLAGQLSTTRRTLLTIDDATMEALVQAFQELPASHAVVGDCDLLQQLRAAQRQLRNLCVLSLRAARDRTNRRGRPTKDAVREFVWQLSSIYEDFARRRPAQRGNFLKFVEKAAHPIDPTLRYAGLENVVREIVTRRKK